MSSYIFNTTIYNDSKLDSRIPKHALSIYEVLKVIDGIPLFLEEHLQRLYHSIELSGKKASFDDAFITEQLQRLIKANVINRGRIKCVIAFHSSEAYFYALKIEEIKLAPGLYKTGIKIKSLKLERYLPGIKMINSKYNQAVTGIINKMNVFDVLLVKEDDKVTECSRANIFFIKGDRLYTTKSEDVLTGITRVHVFDLCKKRKINIEEKHIFVDELNTFESAFITGTSPGILPVFQIDDHSYKVENKIVQIISQDYFAEVDDYIKKKLT